MGTSDRDIPTRQVTGSQLVAFNMAQYRKKAEMSQAELGEDLGWSNAIVSAAERSWDGKRVRRFDADEVVRIALALDVPVVALFLPPPDAGIAARYVLGDQPGAPDVMDLLPQLASIYGDSPALGAVRGRLMALGASRHIDEVDAIVTSARYEANEMLSRARDEAEGLLNKVYHEAVQVTGDARVRAEALERDAQEMHRSTLGELVLTRVELERRIDDLRDFEREYRRRLLAYLEGQVADLKAGDYDDGVLPPLPPREHGEPQRLASEAFRMHHAGASETEIGKFLARSMPPGIDGGTLAAAARVIADAFGTAARIAAGDGEPA